MLLKVADLTPMTQLAAAVTDRRAALAKLIARTALRTEIRTKAAQ